MLPVSSLSNVFARPLANLFGRSFNTHFAFAKRILERGQLEPSNKKICSSIKALSKNNERLSVSHSYKIGNNIFKIGKPATPSDVEYDLDLEIKEYKPTITSKEEALTPTCWCPSKISCKTLCQTNCDLCN